MADEKDHDSAMKSGMQGDGFSGRAVVLRRSWNIWGAFLLCLIPGIIEWKALSSGAYASHDQGYFAAKAHFLGLILPLAIIPAMAYDGYLRFVKRARLIFSDKGIGDYASLDQLGEIDWSLVSAVTQKRLLVGTTFTIRFKQGARINGQSPDQLSIDSMRVTTKQAEAIDSLLAMH